MHSGKVLSLLTTKYWAFRYYSFLSHSHIVLFIQHISFLPWQHIYIKGYHLTKFIQFFV